MIAWEGWWIVCTRFVAMLCPGGERVWSIDGLVRMVHASLLHKRALFNCRFIDKSIEAFYSHNANGLLGIG